MSLCRQTALAIRLRLAWKIGGEIFGPNFRLNWQHWKFCGLKVDGQIYLSKKSIKIRTIDLIFKVISNISSDICSSRLISSHLKPKDRIKHLWFRNPMTLKPTRPSLKNLILSTVKHFQDHCGSREQEKVNDNSWTIVALHYCFFYQNLQEANESLKAQISWVF